MNTKEDQATPPAIPGWLIPENPTRFDYLHAIRAIASRSGADEIYHLADAAMQMGDAAQLTQCGTCDGSGDVHRPDGEYLGECGCKTAARPTPITTGARRRCLDAALPKWVVPVEVSEEIERQLAEKTEECAGWEQQFRQLANKAILDAPGGPLSERPTPITGYFTRGFSTDLSTDEVDDVLDYIETLERQLAARPTQDVKRMGDVTICRNGYVENIERRLAEARAQRDMLAKVLHRCDPGEDYEISEDAHEGKAFCELSVGDMRAIREALAAVKGGNHE